MKNGENMESEKDLAALVAKAREGDNAATADLYELTYDKVYVTVKSMIKDEDTVFDIVQDSYMKAFAHLDSFQGGEKFTAWMKTIAANTARDWLKKQRPMLFSELNAGEDMDEPAEARFVDERNENLPEWVIEQEETKRLLREILETLPEDQRAAIGMFYYEELSVKDIAAAMGCTESAVKSRLMYGRKKVEKEVRALEKKGTKLYGLAGIPFLLWLLRCEEVHAAESPDVRILENLQQVRIPAGSAETVQLAESAEQA
ncbi:MAG: RNA polymerase sigma factor, partial [Lachnospiraceae bacterium]|nr:RNA polymerase sigma factor [Lachnospiraceae bacterium]